MRSIEELGRAAADALTYLEAQADVAEAEVFASANAQLLARLNYTSHIPCNGVEEPKSTERFGLGVTALFGDAGDGPRRVGFGSAAGDLTISGVEEALSKARDGAVADPEFHGLPDAIGESRTLHAHHDPALARLGDDDLVAAGWHALREALRVFQGSEPLQIAAAGRAPRDLGLIVGGDVTIVQERVAVVSSRLRAVQTDEGGTIRSYLTAMVEAEASKGSGFDIRARLADFDGAAGRAAAEAAIRQIGGVAVPSGAYRVVFGPQAVNDLFTHLILPGLHASAFYQQGSPFQGKAGSVVAHPSLTVTDDGARPGAAGSKGITDEGLPAGRTRLIAQGRLVGLLTNWYDAQRLRHDHAAAQKLGLPAEAFAAGLVPRNGFRIEAGSGRSFSRQPGTAATNLFIQGEEPLPSEELLRRVGNGLYIGRIWYTYPINGLRAADFTSTVVGDSYVISDGRLQRPLAPNRLRINDNVVRLLNQVIGVGRDARPTIAWGGDDVIHAPEIGVEGVRCLAIGEGQTAG